MGLDTKTDSLTDRQQQYVFGFVHSIVTVATRYVFTRVTNFIDVGSGIFENVLC
jgi:hypothetical protein